MRQTPMDDKRPKLGQDNLLEIRDLQVEFRLKEGVVRAVNGVSLSVPTNKTLGIVGESGCGKSVTSRAILRILPKTARITQGSIHLAGRNGDAPTDVTQLSPTGKAIRAIRGRDVAMIFQEPMVSLSPVHTIGNQIMESIRLHQKATKSEALAQAIEILGLVGVPSPEKRVHAYPHELSGGLRQRAMIATALACRPRLLIADEPTTALDVTVQRQILQLLRRLQEELNITMIMITHDLGIIAQMAHEVAVMYCGRVVEQGPVDSVMHDPKHPYTQGLLECVPRFGKDKSQTLITIPGSLPDPFTILPGCPFHPRCANAMAGQCDHGAPPDMTAVTEDHGVACLLYEKGGST